MGPLAIDGFMRCSKTSKELHKQVDAVRSGLDTAYDQVSEHLKPGG